MATSPPSSEPPGATLGFLALSRSGTDRNSEHREDDSWLAQRWADPDTRVIYVEAGRTWVRHTLDGAVELASVPTRDALPGERYLLGTDDEGVTFFAVCGFDSERAGAQLGAASSVGLREVGTSLGDRDMGLLVHAIALANWHTTHTHCPRCGGPTQVAAAGAERRCLADGSTHFPRTDPAVIVTVTAPDGRVLLGRQEQWPQGRFSTLAGFVEPGEDAERAVVREVLEEAGIEVGAVGYLGSQPWPFPASLMLGFTARAVDAREPRPDGVELAQARWFDRETLLAELLDGRLTLPPPLSIARRLIEHWYGAELPDGPESWT